MMPARAVGSFLLASALAILGQAAAADPWRLDNRTPDWLSVSAVERFRVEVMDNTFRAVDPGFDQMTTSRVLLAAEATGRRWYAGVEIQDSRAWWHDNKTPVGTADVNAGEFLQAYLGLKLEDALGDDASLSLQAGRMVLSMGNKRIVARNGYRNTINGFEGALLDWQRADSARVRAFYLRPLERLPNNLDRDALRDNDVENDKSSSDHVLWGLEMAQFPLAGEASWDLYLVRFEEKNRPLLPALEREHYTLGGRAYDTSGAWQWEIEAAWQWGESRAGQLSADSGDLDHRAGLLHAEISRGLELPGEPRLILKYDFATGDSDPTDGKSERFDTLFAARSRDFGLLGLFGPFFYANINSPAAGIKFNAAPGIAVESFYRPAWLAEKRDIFLGGALVDPSGNSGDFLGHQFHIRLDWAVLPQRLSLMFGVGYLNKGEFLRNAPRAPDNGDTIYGVSQFTLNF